MVIPLLRTVNTVGRVSPYVGARAVRVVIGFVIALAQVAAGLASGDGRGFHQ